MHAAVLWAVAALIVAFNALAGANDGGNLMATLVGARALTPFAAGTLLLLAISAGPWLVGVRVARTIVSQVVDLVPLGPAVLVAALLGALATLAATYWRRVPTSSSLALVGGLVGAGLAAGGPHAVVWHGLARVLGGMLATIAAGYGLGWLAARGLRALLRGVGVGAATWLRLLQFGGAALEGTGYGSNDAAKVIGLLALWGAWAAGHPSDGPTPPAWAVLASSASFGLGMALGGWRIAQTMGFRVFRVRTADALATQLAVSVAVVAAAWLGNPVSTTSTATTALLGVAVARRRTLPNWRVLRDIAAAWAVTLPLAVALGAAAVYAGACAQRLR